MSQPILKSSIEEFKGALNQSLASLAVAKAAYSSMMLTPEQVLNLQPRDDNGYKNLLNATESLELAMICCTATIFDRAKEDQRKEAAKPAIVQMNGGNLHN